MIKITSFTPIPNCVYDYLAEDKITATEFIVLSGLLRKTYGWHKDRESIRNKELARLCNMSINSCKKAADSLRDKDLIDIKYVCPDCDSEVRYNPPVGIRSEPRIEEYQCSNCESKSSPTKVYEPKIGEISSEQASSIDTFTPPAHKKISMDERLRSRDGKAPTSQKQPPQIDTHPLSNSASPPCQILLGPLSNSARVTALKPLSDNVPQTPKETLKRNSLKEISQSEKLTKEDQWADWENFDILEEREISEKPEPEEEKKEERDFRTIEEKKPDQIEPEGSEKLDKFTAGLLADIGNNFGISEEEKTEREDKSSEKEIKDLLNSCMSNGWNLQISSNDNKIIKEIMTFPYKDVQASCDDRLTINRPGIPKLFPKWVLDGLRMGIKAKKPTQLEKEAFLENELEKSYQKGGGDKILCKDILTKLYNVVLSVGIMDNRYRNLINWCEWKY